MYESCYTHLEYSVHTSRDCLYVCMYVSDVVCRCDWRVACDITPGKINHCIPLHTRDIYNRRHWPTVPPGLANEESELRARMIDSYQNNTAFVTTTTNHHHHRLDGVSYIFCSCVCPLTVW